jgi:hypothetical protein
MSFQDSAILLLFGQVITVVVVIITNNLNRRHSQKLLETELQMRKRIEHLEAQLTKLYAPIYALLSINSELLGLTYDPTGNQPAKKVPDDLWKDLRDNIVKPNNQAIVEILKSNFHLLEGTAIPKPVIDFIVHAEVWLRRDKFKLDRDNYLSSFAFPPEFANYIMKTTKNLKEEHQNLVARVDIDDKRKSKRA